MKNLHLHKMLNLTKNVNCSTGATWASVHIRCGDSNHAERSDHYMEQVCPNYWFQCLFLCIKMSNLFLRNELSRNILLNSCFSQIYFSSKYYLHFFNFFNFSIFCRTHHNCPWKRIICIQLFIFWTELNGKGDDENEHLCANGLASKCMRLCREMWVFEWERDKERGKNEMINWTHESENGILVMPANTLYSVYGRQNILPYLV